MPRNAHQNGLIGPPVAADNGNEQLEEHTTACVICKSHNCGKGEVMQWAQCCKCEGWFHVNCGRVNFSNLLQDKDFISSCHKCKNRQQDDKIKNMIGEEEDSDSDTEETGKLLKLVPRLNDDHLDESQKERIELYFIQLELHRASLVDDPPVGATVKIGEEHGAIVKVSFVAGTRWYMVCVDGKDQRNNLTRNQFTPLVPEFPSCDELCMPAIELGCIHLAEEPALQLLYEFDKIRPKLVRKKVIVKQIDGGGVWYRVNEEHKYYLNLKEKFNTYLQLSMRLPRRLPHHPKHYHHF